LYPETFEPPGDHESPTLWDAGAEPAPLTDSTEVDGEALLPKAILAELVPLACGVKVTVKEAVFPAGIVIGTCIPPKENSGVLTEADETVTLDPLAARVADIL
jgi:hypothetical protein